MLLIGRNYLPLRIQGPKGTKILPIYLHLQRNDLIWANEPTNQSKLLQVVSNSIITNIEEIELASKSDQQSSKKSFSRLSASSEEIQLTIAYMITSSRLSPICIESGNQLEFVKNVSFGLILWVFRDSNEFNRSHGPVPVDDLIGEDF
jgi:hypothetical protein